ncbi:hypothetical protein RB614_12655 [Phytohabitans sp. ZYX-F-186]|uniref:Uncharacterized protein n=1 Tax=Phytohabitans maris TaxID=3071409 RepID=A0ABU0ZG18_9ACTN|nr:hypothetical protein [Phytohabitans sp. ZYX-F-186]MDQ7905376.1 hypothetical protein [Phytohabitans sp. ZYX-F-186]
MAALLSAPGTAEAAAAPAASTDQIAAAVTRIVGNKYSAADLALVKTRPEIARHVPAPDGLTISVKADGYTLAQDKGAPAAAGGAALLAENCAGAIDVGLRQKSLLGNVIWAYIHHVEACTDNVNVTRFVVRRDMTRTDGTIEILEQTQDVAGATPRAWTTSMFQRHLKQCLSPLIPCTNWYPWIRITLYADHTYTPEGSITT